MAVTIGGGNEHGFDQPLGLLSDCHRRIERFLGVLARVADTKRGASLADDERSAVAAALRYFREAAPRHTADEEESLFPRMRESADPAVREALAKVDALEADHRRAEQLHAEVERLFEEWYYEGRLPADKDARLLSALADLTEIYAEHIRVEDEEVFPLAGRALDRGAQESIGREMAGRRGVRPAGLVNLK